MSTGKRKQVRGRPSLYPLEFRRDAVAMVLDEHRAIADVARSVGVNEGTLGNWVNKERVERGQRDGSSAALHPGNRHGNCIPFLLARHGGP